MTSALPALGAGLPALLAAWLWHAPVLLPVAPLTAWWWTRRRRVRRARESALRREAAVVDLCAALAAELRTGATPDLALAAVAGPGGPVTDLLRRAGLDCARVLAAARLGGDVPAALRRVARQPGAEGAAGVAACWQVARDGGVGLAAGLERTAEALRARQTLREAVRSELAGPRSTVALLAVLPAFGLLLGSALGADPLRVLLHTGAGLGCLLTGLLLEAAGVAWTARMVRDAEGPAALSTAENTSGAPEREAA